MQPGSAPRDGQNRGKRSLLAVVIALLLLLLFGGSFVLGRQSAASGLDPTAGSGAQNLASAAPTATAQPTTSTTGKKSGGSNSSGGSSNSGSSGGSNGPSGGSGSGGSSGNGNGGSGSSGSGGSGGSGSGGSSGSGDSGSGQGSTTSTGAIIAVSPGSITIHVGLDGAATTRTLTITNSGDATLTYSIVGLPSYASLSGRSGAVAPHSSTTITINFVMAALGLGTHNGNIEIDNSSSNAPVVLVPVSTQVSL